MRHTAILFAATGARLRQAFPGEKVEAAEVEDPFRNGKTLTVEAHTVRRIAPDFGELSQAEVESHLVLDAIPSSLEAPLFRVDGFGVYWVGRSDRKKLTAALGEVPDGVDVICASEDEVYVLFEAY